MAMGKAVVCTRTKGQVELIEEGKTGIFVPQGNPRALREAILHLWSHPDEAERMGNEARKHVEKHHTLEQFYARFREVVEDAIADYPLHRPMH